MRGRIWKRGLAVLLTAALAVQTAPITSLAEPETYTASGEAAAFQEEKAAENTPEPDILAEDEAKREPGVKHFRRSDGSYVAAIYNEPVHYEKDGKLLDIDNTLVEKDGYYTNTANSLMVRLPKQASPSSPMVVEHQGKTLRFFMEGQQTSSAALRQADADETVSRLSASAAKEDKQQEKNERKLQAKKQHAAVTYPESLDGASLTYDVKGSTLKESLILKKLTGRKSYSFKIEAEGLRAEVQTDNSVHFYAEGAEEPVFVVAAPYMFDAAGEYSSAVAVQLKKTGNHYRYTLTPDRAWLEAGERVWPVTVDPTIQTKQDVTKIQDARGYSRYSTVNYAQAHMLNAGSVRVTVNGKTTTEEFRSYIKLPKAEGITSSSRIIEAKMNLIYYQESDAARTVSNNVLNLYRVTAPWDQTKITWGTQPSCDWSRVIDYVVADKSKLSGNARYDTFDITALAQDWYQNGNDNGVVIRANTLDNAKPNCAEYYSANVSAQYQAARPYAFIAYRDTKGVEDYWTYTSLPAGRGTVTVNNFNGNLIMTQDDIGNDGARMPVAISHIFNASGSNIAYCGTNWRTNFNLSIEKTTGELLTRGYKYYLIDADGTEHYFYFKDSSGNNTATGKDEDGLGKDAVLGQRQAGDDPRHKREPYTCDL